MKRLEGRTAIVSSDIILNRLAQRSILSWEGGNRSKPCLHTRSLRRCCQR